MKKETLNTSKEKNDCYRLTCLTKRLSKERKSER